MMEMLGVCKMPFLNSCMADDRDRLMVIQIGDVH